MNTIDRSNSVKRTAGQHSRSSERHLTIEEKDNEGQNFWANIHDRSVS